MKYLTKTYKNNNGIITAKQFYDRSFQLRKVFKYSDKGKIEAVEYYKPFGQFTAGVALVSGFDLILWEKPLHVQQISRPGKPPDAPSVPRLNFVFAVLGSPPFGPAVPGLG